MKIIIFAPGNSIHTHRWVDSLKEKKHEVTLITFGSHYDKEYSNSVQTIVLKSLFKGKFSYLTTIWELKKILKSLEYDIFHAHFASSYGFIASLAKPKPFILSVWGTDVYKFPNKNPIFRRMLTNALKKADVVCSTSYDMAKVSRKLVNRPYEIIPFGVDTTHFKPGNELKQSDETVFGIVKTLTDFYGIPDLLHAFNIVHQQRPNTKLILVGKGTQVDKYKKWVKERNLEESVTFYGPVPHKEVPKYMQLIDVFVVPSREYESFGVVAVEASACGIPVIGTSAGGLKEVVLEGKTGYIVPNKEPQKIANAMLKLADSPLMRNEMGEAGRVHVLEHFRWEKNVESMIDIYHYVRKNKPRK